MRFATSCAACAVFLALAGCGITGNLRLNPGFAAFGSPGTHDTDRNFALSLGPLPLALARRITHDEPELSAMLADLKGVRVYTYEVQSSPERVRERIEGTRSKLIDEGWEPIVAVRDDGEWTSALVRMDGADLISGIAVLSHDDEEVFFVNLIGDIRPETVGRLMTELDMKLPVVTIDPTAETYVAE